MNEMSGVNVCLSFLFLLNVLIQFYLVLQIYEQLAFHNFIRAKPYVEMFLK